MDDGGWTVVRPFVEKLAIDYPVALANKRTVYLYGDIDRLPVTFLVDREQRVAAIHAGLLKREDLEQEIAALLEESPR
jgi:hypothetical protein